MERQFILCYHDFSVKNAGLAAQQIRWIAQMAKNPITVAVIPDVDGASAAEVDFFKREIEKLSAENFELLLHGASHLAKDDGERTFWGRRAMQLTQGEAEFAGLGEEDSLQLLSLAIDFWNSLGFQCPRGFVPPTWYGNAYLRKQVLAQFDFFEDRFFIYAKGRNFFSPALSFAGLPRLSLQVAQRGSCFVLQNFSGVPRLVFHPVDFETLGEKRILNLIRFAGVKREQVYYRSLL